MSSKPVVSADTSIPSKFESWISVESGLFFVPENLDSANSETDFEFPDSAISLRKVLAGEGIDVGFPIDGGTPTTRHLHSSAIIVPTLIVGVMYLSENPDTVSMSLSVIANYIHELLGGSSEHETVKFSMHVVNGEKSKRLDWEGPPTSAPDTLKLLKEIGKDV